MPINKKTNTIEKKPPSEKKPNHSKTRKVGKHLGDDTSTTVKSSYLKGKHGSAIVLIHNMEFCGHCKMMENDWIMARASLLQKGINVMEIHSSQVGQLSNELSSVNITGVPTILKVDARGRTTPFNGARTTTDFVNFML